MNENEIEPLKYPLLEIQKTVESLSRLETDIPLLELKLNSNDLLTAKDQIDTNSLAYPSRYTSVYGLNTFEKVAMDFIKENFQVPIFEKPASRSWILDSSENFGAYWLNSNQRR